MAGIEPLIRGMVVDVNLNPTLGSETGKIRPGIIVTNDVYNARVPVIQIVPITAWSAKKAMIATNVVIEASHENGLSKKSVADCLQTRPVDRRQRVLRSRGSISQDDLEQIDHALALVFSLK